MHNAVPIVMFVVACTGVCSTRYFTADWLHDSNATDWLDFSRITMGTSALALALLVTVWVFHRATVQPSHRGARRYSSKSPAARPAERPT